jgi:hypothetical protein
MSNFYMWVVFNRPVDFPNHFVARKFIGIVPTTEHIVCNTLQKIRNAINSQQQLHRLERHPGDDPKIIEVWI